MIPLKKDDKELISKMCAATNKMKIYIYFPILISIAATVSVFEYPLGNLLKQFICMYVCMYKSGCVRYVSLSVHVTLLHVH